MRFNPRICKGEDSQNPESIVTIHKEDTCKRSRFQVERMWVVDQLGSHWSKRDMDH
jgi:hypothetical protein